MQRSCLPTGVGSLGIGGLTGQIPSYVGQSTSKKIDPLSVIQIINRRGGQVSSIPHGYRSRELEWRRTHTEDLEEVFANEWVVLEGEQIVAHGRDPVQLVNEARAKGIQNPYVFFVESTLEDVVKMGL